MKALSDILAGITLAYLIDATPFHLNLHKLPYTHYRCIKCWRPPGTRKRCRC